LIRLPEAQEDSEAQQFYRGQGHYLKRQLNSVRSYSGGAGAVSTAEDYSKFLEMLRLNGRYKNGRILGRKSVELMTINHLAPDVEFRPGSGFGLGFNVVTDLGLKGQLGSEASYGWGGAYHSIYWVDPRENLIVSYMTQLIPANNIDDHARIRALIYQAID
jgi:CubicO group peptidase (beta-lactamase class C family)